MFKKMLTLYCVLCLVGRVLGRVYLKTVEVWYNSDLAVYDQLMPAGFGFLARGELHFTMACPTPVHINEEPAGRPDFWLLSCSAADAREFSRLTTKQMNFGCQGLSNPIHADNEFSTADTYCAREQVFQNASILQGQFIFWKRWQYDTFTTMLLLQCPVDRHNKTAMYQYDCQSKLMTLNPGGNQLSSDEIPMPVIYTVINLVWASLVAAWFFNWVIYFKFSNCLHRLISCAPVFKVVLVVLILLWWQEIASTGIESQDILSLRHFVQSIEDALLFTTMMIIAEGWGVVRCQIKHYRWTSLLLLFALFATSMMCVHWVHRYFLAFSVCFVVFMMYKTLKWSSHNIELLRRRRRKIRRFITRHNLRYKGVATIDMQLCHKLHIYHRFRIICAAFSLVYAIAVTLSTFLQEFTYVRALTFEIPELLVYVSIGFIFRLRNFEPYEHIELVPPRENVIVMELPDVSYGQVEPHVQLGVPLHFKVEKETQTPRRRWRTTI